MKQCPQCSRVYVDESLNFCLDDGSTLLPYDGSSESPTAIQLPNLPSEERSSTADRTQVLPSRKIKDNGQSHSFNRIWIIVAAIIILGVGGFFAFRYLYSGNDVPITSIAVLPFKSRGGDADVQYLSEGLAESLIYRLSQLPELRVSPTSSVFRYEDKDIDPVAVGNELGVNAVLSGRIVQHGDNLTISADLVDIRSNRLLWGEQFDRKTSDLLDTQREIARQIVENLKLKISPQEKGLAKNYTESNEAYQLYLKGRFYWNKRTTDGINTAIDFFNQAIQQDPTFALAYVGLADCYLVPSNPIAPKDKMPKAKAAILRALQLDNSLAEAHTSLARILFDYDWNWREAEKEFRLAMDIDPRYATAHQWYGGFLESLGRNQEAIAERKKALELDPLSLITNFELGLGYFYARNYDQAINQFHKTLELQPDFPEPYLFLPLCFEAKGQYEAAESALKVNIENRRESSVATANRAYFYAIRGRTSEAREILKELEQKAAQEYVPADAIAMVYDGLGDSDKVFVWLQRAYEEHAFKLAWLRVEPHWDRLRPDPRFQDLIKRIGIPE